jgi:hypothetical protein
MIRELLGQFFLCAATILYVTQLLPQLHHTLMKRAGPDLSRTFMVVMYLGYFLDYIFSIVQDMPIQYQAVAVLGLFQMQLWLLMVFFPKKNVMHQIIKSFVIIFLTTLLVSHCKQNVFTSDDIFIVSQTCFFSCWLIQCRNSTYLKKANSLNHLMIWASLCAVYLDYGAAWLLEWRTSYLVCAGFALIYHSIMQGTLLRLKRKEVQITL